MFRVPTRSSSAAALVAVGASALCLGCGAGAAPQAHASSARSADGFVDSIGVNVHLGYSDTPYARHDKIRQELVRLGIRHVRDGLFPDRPDTYQAFRALAASGIKADLVVGDPRQRSTIGPLRSQLALIKSEQLGAAVQSLEGPNQFDVDGGKRWPAPLRRYQSRLYSEVNADPGLRRFPVLGPALGHRSSFRALGDISGSLDYGNIHPYPRGKRPDGPRSDLDRQRRQAKANSRKKPVQVTETGYHNGIRSASPHLPTTEHAAATYLPRLFLDYYRHHVARTYSYELLDERRDAGETDLQANFGLLRNNFSEKPAYTAIRRLTHLLSDPGPGFKTSRLRYSVEGSRSGLRRILLQKHDGTFYLALWRDERVWDPLARKRVHAPSKAVRVTLRRRGEIQIYRPSRSGRALRTRSHARSVSLRGSADVAIIKIRLRP